MLAIIKEVKKYHTKPTNKETIWTLEFLAYEPQSTDSLMGWIGSGNTLSQVKLTFDNCKKATQYAKDNEIEYLVQTLDSEGNVKQSKKSYLDIFSD